MKNTRKGAAALLRKAKAGKMAEEENMKTAAKKTANTKTAVPPKLTEAERSLLADMEHGYRLETDSLAGTPVLRRLKDNLMVRPASVNKSTIKAMEERGLIERVEGRDPLIILWRAAKRAE